MKWVLILFVGLSTCLSACSEKMKIDDEGIVVPMADGANVVSVTTSGEEGNYIFSIGVHSPDTGCDQYANWWEVITEDGQLIYRRILGHSHVEEQPFIRSGGKVEIAFDQIVIVRAHMNTLGNGSVCFKGSVESGFSEIVLTADFAQEIERQDPQPGDCPF